MLACVSSLKSVESYKSVRNRKRWLTTNEALSYIDDNCPFLSLMLSWADKPYVVLYSWANWKTSMRPQLTVERVKDNNCRKVVFWDARDIDSEEQLWKDYFENGNWRLKGRRWQWAYKIYKEEQRQKTENIVETIRGAFYDPEWFL